MEVSKKADVALLEVMMVDFHGSRWSNQGR